MQDMHVSLQSKPVKAGSRPKCISSTWKNNHKNPDKHEPFLIKRRMSAVAKREWKGPAGNVSRVQYLKAVSTTYSSRCKLQHYVILIY